MSTVWTALSRVAAPREPLDSSIEEAREALEYWSRRAERLPWHRRAARRECRQMIAAWRATLVEEHLTRWRLGRVAEAVLPLLDARGPGPGRRTLRWMRRSTLGRVVVAVAVTWVAMATVTLALIIAIAMHVLG